MKSEKIYHALTLGIFIAFIGIFALLFWLMPKKEMSELERRQLSSAPLVTTDNIFSGQFGKDAETYLSDHFPLRSTWVGMHAHVELWTGRNLQNGIYIGKEDRLYVAPAEYNKTVIDRNSSAMADFVLKNELNASYIIIPSVGYLDGEGLPAIHKPYRDADILADIDAVLSDLSAIRPTLNAEHFYRTDHHWTSLGAYQAYLAFAESKGFTPLAESDFHKERVTGFYGTSYAKAGIWETAPDEMELWSTDTALTVEIYDNGKAQPVVSDSVFFRDALDKMDKYTVYLDGNHARVRITNPEKTGKLLVIKDSFAQTLVPMLAEHYGTVEMIDLRHFRQQKVSEYVKQEGYTDVLFVYGIDSIAASNDLLWLE